MNPNINYDESKIPAYTVPELFPAGTTALQWLQNDRPKWLQLLREYQFGAIPPAPSYFAVELLDEKRLEGVAGKRRQYRITYRGTTNAEMHLDVAAYLPDTTAPCPCFCGLNFLGNHALDADPDVRLPDFWLPEHNLPAAEHRGDQVRRLPLKDIIGRGYAHLTACYDQIYPDHTAGSPDSIYQLFQENPPAGLPAISAWAWGIQRLADLALTIPEIAPDQLMCIGHSRLGKASLWAGACDERFKVVVTNDSGQGGAALTRRLYGETYENMFDYSPFGVWFTPKLREYIHKVQDLPVDAHCLMACVAPRGLCVGSATEDQWADPKGERLSVLLAEPVWRLFGAIIPEGDSAEPTPGEARLTVATENHYRVGQHDILAFDWNHYMDFADQFFGRA